MAVAQPPSKYSEAAIFARLWDGKERLTVPVARYILKLGFGDEDTARMHELAERNRAGELTPAEQEELDNFVRVGDLLAILQLKARKLLKQTGARNGNG
jgi:hypothetical protein